MISPLSCNAHSLGRPGSVQRLLRSGLDSAEAPSAIALWTASVATAAMFRFAGKQTHKRSGASLWSVAVPVLGSHHKLQLFAFGAKLPVLCVTPNWQPPKSSGRFAAWANDGEQTQSLKSTLPGGWGSLGLHNLGCLLALFQEQSVGPFLQGKGRVVGSVVVFCVHHAECSKGWCWTWGISHSSIPSCPGSSYESSPAECAYQGMLCAREGTVSVLLKLGWWELGSSRCFGLQGGEQEGLALWLSELST